MTIHTFFLHPCPPFDFESTTENQPYFRKGQDPSVDVYVRLLELGDKLALATVQSVGTVDKPDLKVTLKGDDLQPSDMELGQVPS